MKQKIEEIKAHAPNSTFKTMYIVADFTKLLTMDAYRETIESKLKELDVSMLILSAGMMQPGPFELQDDSMISNIVTCNVMHSSYLPKVMAN